MALQSTLQPRTDTHAHTVASTHAYSTVHDYFHAAKTKGIDLFAITDHAPTMPDAPHYWHFGNMKVLPRIVDNIAMLRGIEANILPDNAGVDVPDGLLPYLDIAIASFHEPVIPPGNQKYNTQCMLRAIESCRIQIIGHPGNPRYPVDIDEIVRAAKDHNVAIEINNSSFTHSREGSEANCIAFLECIAKHDWKVVFASDAHSAFHLGELSQCVAKAEAVGFPMHNVVSATAASLLAFLAEHDKPVANELQDWLRSLD